MADLSFLLNDCPNQVVASTYPIDPTKFVLLGDLPGNKKFLVPKLSTYDIENSGPNYKKQNFIVYNITLLKYQQANLNFFMDFDPEAGTGGTSTNADTLDNQHGSFYLDRSNHTGSQPISSVTGLEAALAGATGDKYYKHVQSISSTAWTINHNLNKNPSVLVLDSAGNTVYGDVDYPTLNQVVVTFSAQFSGEAYLN